MSIIILSVEADATTSVVMEWINYFDGVGKRVNSMHVNFSLKLTGTRKKTIIKDEIIAGDSSLWFRKGGGVAYTEHPVNEKGIIGYQASTQTRSDYGDLREWLVNSFGRERTLGNRGGGCEQNPIAGDCLGLRSKYP